MPSSRATETFIIRRRRSWIRFLSWDFLLQFFGCLVDLSAKCCLLNPVRRVKSHVPSSYSVSSTSGDDSLSGYWCCHNRGMSLFTFIMLVSLVTFECGWWWRWRHGWCLLGDPFTLITVTEDAGITLTNMTLSEGHPPIDTINLLWSP